MGKAAVEGDARRIAAAEGFTVDAVERVLDADCDGEHEVLFHGRYTGGQRPHDEDPGLYRVIVRGDATGHVRAGW